MVICDASTVITSLLTRGGLSLIFTLAFFTAVLVIYATFVYYFYKFLAKKNIIDINFERYNTAGTKFLAAIFYIIEYLIILPIVTFFWFAVLAALIIVLAEGIDVSTILIISASLVAAVRVTAYISENLSRDLAKMLPFTLIAIAITKPGFFEIPSLLSRFSEIPSLFANIPYYLLFIVCLELFMRFAEFLSSAFKTRQALPDEVPIAPN
jgi:hypothetical protein